MMWWAHDLGGWGWLWMSISMILLWGLAALGIYWLVRTARAPIEHHHERPPQDILAERFARGELSAEEFSEAETVLLKAGAEGAHRRRN